VVTAFKVLQQAKQIGKVVLSFDRRGVASAEHFQLDIGRLIRPTEEPLKLRLEASTVALRQTYCPTCRRVKGTINE